MGFPGGSEVKASAHNAGDLGLIPGLGRPPGEGNGNPLQYSCLENPSYGFHFAMGGWVVVAQHPVMSSTDDNAVFDNYRTERAAIACQALVRKRTLSLPPGPRMTATLLVI